METVKELNNKQSEEKLRKTDLDIISKLPWGTHFCHFYQTKQDIIEILVPYFKQGLENNEFCIWITAEPLNVKDAKAALKEKVKNLDDYIKKGQIEILDYSQWYTKTGAFEANKVLEDWMKKEKEVIGRGFDGLRFTGNISWLEKKDWNSFINYEAIVDSIIKQHRMLAICSYSLDRCRADEVIDVVNNHKCACIKRQGTWVFLEPFERNKTEEALRENERELYITLDATTSGIYKWNFTTNVLFFSPRYYTMLGYNPDEFPATYEAWKSLIHPDDLAVALRIAEDYLASKPDFYNNEFRMRTKTGGYRWIHARSTVVERDEYGNAVRIIGNHEDITERKKTEEALRQSEERYRTLAESSTDPIFVQDREGRYIYTNQAGARVLEKQSSDVIGKKMRYFFTKKEEKERLDSIRLVFRKKRSIIGERILKVRGSVCAFLVTIAPIFDSKGNVSAVVSVSHDITELKKTEKELIESKADLQEQKSALERKNIALGEIIKQVEIEKNKIKDNVLTNVNELMMPILKKLRAKGVTRKYIDLLNNRLQALTSSLGRNLTKGILKLTPKEIEICNMIEGGLASKEIADFLNVSYQTVEKHRKDIRKKLGLDHKKINLTTYLQKRAH